MSPRIHRILLVLCFACFGASAQANADPHGQLNLEVGAERFLALGAASERISIGNENVLNVQVMDPLHLRLLGLTSGTTTLSVWQQKSGPPTEYEVSVSPPLASLREQLAADPDLRAAHLDVHGAKVILSGEFADAESRARALELVKYVAGPDILDMTRLSRSAAIEVDVKFVILSETTLDALGINFSSLGQGFAISGTAPSTLSGLQFNEGGERKLDVTSAPPLGAAFNLLLASPSSNILGILSTLKSANLARTLAEPTLVARSGDPADFLVGGEVPIPVPQGGNTGAIGIEYKQFGVRLKVKPTILPDAMISLELNPEVSELDFSNAVTIQGFVIPALRSRSTTTTVDLPAGHTLVLAGLMFQSAGSIKERVPYLSQIPLLGELFKRTQKNGERQQLVVAVTPRLVDAKSSASPVLDHYKSLLDAPTASTNATNPSGIDEPGIAQ